MDQMQNTARGFSGTIHGIQLMDFIQLACLARWSRTIRVQSDSCFGRAHIRSGQLFHAEVDALAGEEALIRILQWNAGRFEASPPDEGVDASITRAWEFLLIEALRLRDAAKSKDATAGDAEREAFTGGFDGAIHGIGLPDLVQLACMTRKDYLLRIESNHGEGKVHVKSGQVCHAEFGELRGEDAFNEVIVGEEGLFDCLPAEAGVPDTIDKPWEYLLIDAMRHRDEVAGANPEGNEEAAQAENLQQRIQKMKVTEKIRAAMTGDKEIRSLLVRDANRLVQLAIISNGRITDGEVAAIASSRSIDEDVLRRIAANREWMNIYAIRFAIATNPKTAIPVATKLIPTLLAKDLKQISKSKSVPTAVAAAARRMVGELR